MGMKHLEGNFSGVKGLKIYYQGWVPDTSPRAIVFISHGIAEHSGRYAHVAKVLVAQNIAVYANDHRGHGKSEGQRCNLDRFDQYTDDLKLFFDLILLKNSGIPAFILGHSMGSLIAIQFAHRYENLLHGLVLSGSGNKAGGDINSFLVSTVKVLSAIVPKMTIKATDLTNYLSHDPNEIEKNRKDPLVHQGGIGVRLAAELFRSFDHNEQLASELKLPLLFQAGSGDRLVLGAHSLATKFTMIDKTIIIYENLWHEVYNEIEPERKMVLKDLENWFEKRVN
jgi:acylglycerol lipase